MAFRKEKGSDPFSQKTNRFDRFAQMSKQEEMIQQKKREIQAKLEAQKRKDAEEAMKKLSASNLNKPGTKKPVGKPLNVRSIAAQLKSGNTSSTPSVTPSPQNIFSNDGSFMDQFRKLSGLKDSKQSGLRKEYNSIFSQDDDDIPEERYSDEKEDRRRRERERDRSRERMADRGREREIDRDRDRGRERDRDRDRDRCRDRDRSREHDMDRMRERSREMDTFRNRRDDRWPNISEPPRSSSPYSPTKVDYGPGPVFPTMFPPPNLSMPPPNALPPNSQPPQFSQPPPQPFISYPANVPPPTQSSQPPPVAVAPPPGGPPPMGPPPVGPPPVGPPPVGPPPVGLPPGGPPPLVPVPPPSVGLTVSPQPIPAPVSQTQIPVQLIPQPSPIQPHSIPPPSPMDPHLIPPPPIPPTGIPPPGLLPPQFQQQPPPVLAPQTNPSMQQQPLPGVPPPSIPHLTGIPPPSIIASYPPLPLLPVPPPSAATSDVKPIEAPPLSALPNLGVPPPSTNGNMQPMALPLKADLTVVQAADSADPNDAVLHLARMVSQCGDDIEEIIKSRNADDPNLWFLHQKDSSAYKQYRRLVEKLSRETDGGNEADDESDRNQNRDVFRKAGDSCENQDKSRSENSLVNQGENDENRSSASTRKRKRRSRWAPEDTKVDVTVPALPPTNIPPPGYQGLPMPQGAPGANPPLLSRVTRTDPALLRYAAQAFGTTNLSEEDWKKAEDHYKINLLYQDMLKKREEIKKLEMKGKHKYEYDSDEEVEGGTWEHKLRSAEMEATERWADELTRQSQGKHHIGDFLPPEELNRFMEKYSALKEDREPDLSDYKEFKLKEDNIGFQMLQKLGWSEGQGLGSDGSGIVDPVNRATTRAENHGLGVDRPDEVSKDDDEFEAYRKRMMLAYRFRPNPLNNPRRPYY